jgi:hypothetical protein
MGHKLRFVLLFVIALAVFAPVQAQSSDSSREEKGVIETGVYISPQFSNEVTWTEEWEIDDAGLQTDNTMLLDKISLSYRNQATAVIMFIEAGGETPEDYARRLIRYRRVAEPGAEIVWSDSDDVTSVMLYSSMIEGREIASLIEIRLVDDERTLQVVELLLYPEYADTVFDLTQTDIVIDGDVPFSFVDEFPTDKIES